jgi:hypothetical protein
MSASSRRENIRITPSYQFDLGDFNTMFEENIDEIRNRREKKIRDINRKFAEQRKIKEQTTFFDLKIYEVFTHFKTSMYGILDDLLNFKFNDISSFINIFIKNNRLFYIGAILIIISIIIYFISQLQILLNKIEK